MSEVPLFATRSWCAWGVVLQRFRGGLVFKAHGLVYHSTLGLRVVKKKKGGPVGGKRLLLPAWFSQLPYGFHST